MNLTFESEQMEKIKKINIYDAMFYSLLNKLNNGLSKENKAVFSEKEKTLYINGAIRADDLNFITLCENYKFFIAKSLF